MKSFAMQYRPSPCILYAVRQMLLFDTVGHRLFIYAVRHGPIFYPIRH